MNAKNSKKKSLPGQISQTFDKLGPNLGLGMGVVSEDVYVIIRVGNKATVGKRITAKSTNYQPTKSFLNSNSAVEWL
jgi:hypothetical protein